MLSQESKGSTKIVTDSRDSGRKKWCSGWEGGRRGRERELSCSARNQTSGVWPIFFMDLCSLSPNISSAITIRSSLPKPSLHIEHMLCSIKNLCAYSGRLAALNRYIKAGFHLPCPQHSHLIMRFVLCTAVVFHKPYLSWDFSSSFKFGWNWVPKFLRGIAERTER